MDEVTDLNSMNLFPHPSGVPCREGMELLRTFAMARRNYVPSLKPPVLKEGANSVFAGKEAWDSFAEHYAICKRCHGR